MRPGPMSDLAKHVAAFAELVGSCRTAEAIERVYDEDVCIIENRELARAGKSACLAYEREQLAGQPTAPRIRVSKFAVNEEQGVAFLEYVIRFTSQEGRAMRLEVVAVQTWSGGKVVQERFYYEGLVDEGE